MNEVNERHSQDGIVKAPTGIEGFDEMSGGGLPRRSMSLVIGGPGCGKTVFALQVLVNGVRHCNEPAIFVAFEESSSQILRNAHSFGWDIPALQTQDLFFLDAKLPITVAQSGLFDLEGLLAGLSAKIAVMNARRIVFDGIDVLLTLLDNPAAERREIYRLHDWLISHDLVGIVTAKSTSNQPTLEGRYEFMHYLTDCTIRLRQDTIQQVSLRKLRILKYRGSSFFENESPMLIGSAGIEVIGPGMHDLDFTASTERISTGVAELDAMLEGGYLRGTAVLITGSPGTAKSTLAGTFAQAACERGEQTLYVSFDETAEELARNMNSVGLGLKEHLQSGKLVIYSGKIENWSAEAYMLELRSFIRIQKPRILILDPITSLLKGGGESEALAVAQKLFTYAKAAGITMVMTSLISGSGTSTEPELSRLAVSTLADTWIHMAYVNQGGEHNRALTIVKSRGTAHSNQVRELILSDQGVRLVDVFTAGGEVLMGTLRWEKEQAEILERERQRRVFAERRRELQAAEAELTHQLETFQRKLEAHRNELTRLTDAESDQEAQWERRLHEIQRLRATDD